MVRVPSFVFLVTVLLSYLVPAVPAAAQPPAMSLDELPARVRVGDTIWVTGADGTELKGKLWKLSPSSLDVMVGGRTVAFLPDTLRSVSARKPESLRNGALIGLGVAVGLVALASIGCEEDYLSCFALGSLGYGTIGMALGVGIDALTPPGKIEIFRGRPVQSARVSVAPRFSGHSQGVVVRVAF